LRISHLLGAALLFVPLARAAVSVEVAPDRGDWTYSPGERVVFTVTASRDGRPLESASVNYVFGPAGMPPQDGKTVPLPAGGFRIDAGTLAQPGFLRLAATVTVGSSTARGLATAAFAPEKIIPAAEDPADFDEFWNQGKSELAQWPVDARLTPMPEAGSSTVDCFHVDLQNVGVEGRPSRLFGVLCEPKRPGKYPALLELPGAGVRAYRGLAARAEKGLITFQLGIHGIPVNLDASVYSALKAGALAAYPLYGLDRRDRYYYRRVYLGIVRAGDFLASRPNWNGSDLIAEGESQGGALSLVAGVLDPRVTGVAVFFPALADMAGDLHGRAGGWPRPFESESDGLNTKENIATAGYYDAVNFAGRLRVPGFFSWGFNDEVCAPTSMYAAFNAVRSPKRLFIVKEAGHSRLDSQAEAAEAWTAETIRPRRVP
jgi:cephalosporin-C deacetylase-like acetyl esterase